MNNIIELVKKLYLLKDYDFKEIPPHEGGRNRVYVCSQSGEDKYVLRISALGDRKESDYLAEAEFIRFLAENSAPVADVVPSVTRKLVESIDIDERKGYISLFEYAKGMLISDNGYRYREGAPLEEYFYNTGKTLGIIHRLSKSYKPLLPRIDYRERYKTEYLNSLIPDSYGELKKAIEKRYERFGLLPINKDSYGLVHFDFSDGNYHIDMNTGRITVFDFDNCMYCWYMFDLANLWTHGVGWCQFEEDPEKRRAYMTEYFNTILEGYRSETEVSEELLAELPLFIDMVLIENIVDEFECKRRENSLPDYEDIEDEADCLINNIPYYAGFFL